MFSAFSQTVHNKRNFSNRKAHACFIVILEMKDFTALSVINFVVNGFHTLKYVMICLCTA